METKGTGQSYNAKDEELIHQLINSRLEQKAQMEYEDLEGYEIPPRTQFSMLKKPAVTVRYKQFTFNTAAVRLFEGVQHVLTILNPKKKRLAVVPCSQEESASVEWARQKDEKWISKTITSLEFVEKIFALMNWDRNCRYKILGRVANSSDGLILLFDLEEAIFYAATPTEYVDRETGEIKKRRAVYYPDEYKGRIGKSYNDYVEARQLSIFEDLEGYVGQTYGDALPSDNNPNEQT